VSDLTSTRNDGARAPFPPLAIIGIGCLFPKSPSVEAFWSLIKRGADAIGDVPDTHWDPADYFSEDKKKPDFTYARRGGFIDPYPFEPLKYGVPPNALEATDTSQLLGLVAAEQAMLDAGYGPGGKSYNRDRASVILGVTGALELVIPLGARLGHPMWREVLIESGLTAAQADDIVQRVSERYVPWQENSFPGLLGNVVAGRISKYLNTGGTNCVVDAACASSLSALELAALELATGKADLAITGGVDTFNDIFMYMCFSKTPALSPTGNARPFDEGSDGTILGEGLGMVVLKRLADAERDGDRIHAVIRGVGSSSDGKGEAIYAPSAPGQVKALRDAYASAGITTDTIELLEAHGTGTSKGDAVETGALREVFGELGDRAPWCAVGSIKSQIGHTKAAAGAAGLIKAALALENKVLPPTIKVEKPAEAVAPGTSPFYVNTAKRPWLPRKGHPRRAGVSSFGFGGSNFHVVVEEYAAKKSAPDWDGNVQLFAYSAATSQDILSQLDSISGNPAWNEVRCAAHASRATFNPADSRRLVFVVDRDKTNLPKLITDIRAQIGKQPDAAWALPDGTHYGVGKPEGDIAVVFPGQGSQYPGMLNDVACLFPEMLDTLAVADDAMGENARRERLSDLIYPHPAFDAATRSAQEAALTATAVAQPALGAVSLGAWRVLDRFGVKASCAAGHSYGELAALCAAGAFDEATLIALSRRRGELMESGDGDRGGMLAVRATLAEIEAVLRAEGLALTPANKNAPDQVVLSGAKAEIERASTAFTEKKLSNTKLNVAAAFHSAFVADAAVPFRSTVADAPFRTLHMPVYANTTAETYPADAEAARDLLANQLARPVEFVGEIEAMYAAGVRTFVEAGPGARLTGLIGKILGARPHRAIAMDASNGARDGVADLARALAALAAEGRACDLMRWDDAYRPAPKDDAAARRMILPICGANYRSETSKPKPRPPIVEQRASTRTDVPQSGGSARASTSDPATVASAQVKPPASPAPGPPVRLEAQGPLADLFLQTQESLEALQRMQEQTARVHAQYLHGQEEAARAFGKLIEQQERLFERLAGDGAIPLPHGPAAGSTPMPRVDDAPGGLAESIAVEPAQEPGGQVAEILLDVVSEKTGYPREMLELTMALDADLGIDSIKRVEILSALQERVPGLPGLEAEELGAIATLGDIVAKLGEASPAASPATVPSRAATVGELSSLLMRVVSEKTGYPVEMLEPGMALDADLGIDSIKRVEILSALQERMPGLPGLEAEELGAIATLRDIIARLGEAGESVVPSAPAVIASTRPVTKASATPETAAVLLEIVSETTGYPADMLELDMALDADLGIDSIKRVEILSAFQERVPDAAVLEAEALAALVTLRDVIAALESGAAAAQTPARPGIAVTQARAKTQKPAAAAETPLSRQGLRPDPIAPAASRNRMALAPNASVAVVGNDMPLRAAVARELIARGLRATEHAPDARDSAAAVSAVVVLGSGTPRDEFATVKAWGAALRNSSVTGVKLLACVARMDGGFGLRNASLIRNFESGALIGLAKTAEREWPDVTVRAIDLAPDFGDDFGASRALIDELLSEGPIETGITREGSATIALRSAAAAGSPVKLSGEDVVVVTGGARGVTAACALAMARAGGPKLALLGRSPMPEAEPEWLRSLTEERALKQALLSRTAGPMSPQELERAYREVVGAREIRAAVDAIAATGATVRYYSADVRNAAGVDAIVTRIHRELGPITGIVHGAGVLADRRIEDKTLDQFDAVYETKVNGIRHLLAAIGDAPLKFLALFSSSTGRFGRVGQADYAMANEALNKLARVEAARRPGCRVVSLNWGPWDGGMVTPSLRKVFEKEGVGVIPLEAGAQLLVEELGRADSEAELVVLAGGDTNAPTAAKPRLTKVLDIELSSDRFPFIASHVIDGRPVLPVAMYIEWMAHAALHANPGMRFVGLEDLRVLKGAILENGAAVLLELAVSKPQPRDGRTAVTVELRGPGGAVTHSAATVLLATTFGQGSPTLAQRTLPTYRGSRDDIYRGLLFHGPMMQGIVSVDGCGDMGVSVMSEAAPAPELWIAEPLRRRWIADPLAIDCAFQALILWSFNRFSMGSLPVRIGRYDQFQTAFPKGGVRIEARIEKSSNHGATAMIEFIDPANGALVARMDGYECVMDSSLNEAFRRNQPLQPLKD
jgi:acyl transferase domain-containing protein/NAD(P)-dependent dehydrogenase (short-subunit alcohol dehydrogenase family)/acyl carrier protein